MVDNINYSNCSQSEWLVASQVGSRSRDVHKVAEALKVLPWVGVALEMNSLAAMASGGRVFCVLPMPHDVSCHLPVHVNATFSLNDERRELKWTGIERTIIKELLQNADDAGATEMNICYDTRHHRATPEKLFFPGMEACHGPALVVHNNAEFTQDDFKNITKLAGATKEGQPLKIGKFGVGFCSVYHITDIPSFISNRYLYIFDPTLTYLKKEIHNPAKPGKKVIFSSKFIRSSQQMAPYTSLFGFNSEETYAGTMFRFPFRTSASELSGKIYSKGDVTKLTQEIQKCSSKLLLFLQNVNCITVSQISDGQTSPKNLLKVVNTKRKLGSLCFHTVTCSFNSLDTTTEHWVVATHTETILRQLSTSSVACALLPQPTEEVLWYTPKPVEGEVFCFLPLSIKTGLPVHVSSNFAVSNNRIGIWTSDDYSRQNIQEVRWNETLMKYTIPKAYNQILEAVKQLHVRSKLHEYVFSSLWPLEAKLQILITPGGF